MPGKYVVLARRHNNDWYIAGVNATSEPLNLNLNVGMLADKNVSLYSDSFTKEANNRIKKAAKNTHERINVKNSDFIPSKRLLR